MVYILTALQFWKGWAEDYMYSYGAENAGEKEFLTMLLLLDSHTRWNRERAGVDDLYGFQPIKYHQRNSESSETAQDLPDVQIRIGPK